MCEYVYMYLDNNLYKRVQTIINLNNSIVIFRLKCLNNIRMI